jgi:hypothetical protein
VRSSRDEQIPFATRLALCVAAGWLVAAMVLATSVQEPASTLVAFCSPAPGDTQPGESRAEGSRLPGFKEVERARDALLDSNDVLPPPASSGVTDSSSTPTALRGPRAFRPAAPRGPPGRLA